MSIAATIRELGVKVSLLFNAKEAKEADASIEKIAGSLKGVGIAAIGAAGSIFGFAKGAASSGRELEENATQLGVNVEALQELEYAAKIAAGVNREELVSSLESVSKTLFEARNNSADAARTLIRLGVPIDMISNKSITADQVLLTLADRFKSMPDGINKTALASEVGFGKLLPLLNKGSQGIANLGAEGRKLGVIMDESLIKSNANFDRELSRIYAVLKSIGILIGSQLIKYLGQITNEFKNFIVQNRRFIASGITIAMKSLGLYLQIIFKVVTFLGNRFKYLVEVMGGLETVSKGVAIAFGFIAGVKILTAFGSLVKSFMSIGSLLAAMSAPAFLIGAAFAAIILVVQDLMSSDSIIKEWIGMFSKEFPNAAKFVVGAFNQVKDVITDVIESIKLVIHWVEYAATEVFPSLSKALSGIGGFFGPALGKIGDFLTNHSTTGGAVDPVQGFLKSSQPPGFGGSSASNVNNNNTANISVTVPRGTTPEQATAIVSGGVENGFNTILRQTRNQYIGGVAR